MATGPNRPDIYVVKIGENYVVVPPIAVVGRHVRLHNLTGEELEVDYLGLGTATTPAEKKADDRSDNEQNLKGLQYYPAGIYSYSVKGKVTGKTAIGNSEPKIIVDP